MAIASASEWKEQTMRRRDGSGEKELRGTMDVIWLRIASREEGWKRIRSLRPVISSVLDGGVGWESGGRPDKSIERDGREEREGWLFSEGEDNVTVDSAMVAGCLDVRC